MEGKSALYCTARSTNSQHSFGYDPPAAWICHQGKEPNLFSSSDRMTVAVTMKQNDRISITV
jgi:hypothetical protein